MQACEQRISLFENNKIYTQILGKKFVKDNIKAYKKSYKFWEEKLLEFLAERI